MAPAQGRPSTETSAIQPEGRGVTEDEQGPRVATEAESFNPLEDLRSRIAHWLHIPVEDADVIDFVLAVYKSNELAGDPLWGHVIDASGGGKTEVLRSLRNRSDTYFLSGLTEKTLISGYRDPKHPGQDPSLLPKLNGKVLIIKDLSPLLSMRRESRNVILAQLRDAYDGFTDQGRGNVGRVSYQSRFSVLAASTLAVDRFDAIDEELGERSVKFRMRSTHTSDKVQQAIKNVGRDSGMRDEIERAVSRFLNGLPKGTHNQQIPDALLQPLTVIADFTAIVRSHVARDRQHNLRYLPRPEVGTRLGKELAKLLVSLAAVRMKPAPSLQELRTVARVAEDCMPPNRLLVLRAIRQYGTLRLADIVRETGLPRTTAAQVLDDLRVVKVINYATEQIQDPVIEPPEELWQLHPDWQEKLRDVPFLGP
jgi:hypothetical protein